MALKTNFKTFQHKNQSSQRRGDKTTFGVTRLPLPQLSNRLEGKGCICPVVKEADVFLTNDFRSTLKVSGHVTTEHSPPRDALNSQARPKRTDEIDDVQSAHDSTT